MFIVGMEAISKEATISCKLYKLIYLVYVSSSDFTPGTEPQHFKIHGNTQEQNLVSPFEQ
jgi:hypothetical protein